MRKTRTANLKVQALEDRLTPAITASLSSGNLVINGDASSNTILISGTAGAIKVHALAGNQYNTYASDPGTFLATNEVPANQVGPAGGFNVTGVIYVVTQNNPDFVAVTIDDGGALPGDVSITTNGGNDDIIIQSRGNGLGSASVNGRIDIKAGAGADNMFLYNINAKNNITADGGTSGTRPNGVFNTNVPGDVFELSGAVTKAVSVTNAITGIDDRTDPNDPTFYPNVINGNLFVNSPTANKQGGYYLNLNAYPNGYTSSAQPGYSGLLVIGSKSVVNGSVTFVGSTEADGVYIDGTVNGNVSINGGPATSTGKNDFVLDGKVTGDYTANGANGVDWLALLSKADVGKSVQAFMRDGDNIYNLNQTFKVAQSYPTNTPNSSYPGLMIYAGSGNDNVGVVNGTVGSSNLVSTNIRFELGNGSNSVEWNGVYVGSKNGRFDYIGGTGTDVLTLRGTNDFRVFANMGDGSDVINVAPGTTASYALLDFGPGVDTYNNASADPDFNNTQNLP